MKGAASIVLVALLAAAAVWTSLAQDDPCEAFADERVCLTGNCNWCVAGSIPPSCHDYAVAEKLPIADFNCGNYSRTDCRDRTTNATCEW